MTKVIEVFADVATIAGMVAIVYSVWSYGLAKRADRVAVRTFGVEALRDITSGEVRWARNVFGTLRYGDPQSVSQFAKENVIDAYYVQVWAIDRCAVVRRLLEESKNHKGVGFLIDSLNWNTGEVIHNLAVVRRVFEISDEDAWERVCFSAEQLESLKSLDVEEEEVDNLRGRLHLLKSVGGCQSDHE